MQVDVRGMIFRGMKGTDRGREAGISVVVVAVVEVAEFAGSVSTSG